MANTLNTSINFTAPFIYYLPQTNGTNNEPAVTTANIVANTIMSPPFTWAWNRATTSAATTQGTQDYTIASLTTWGYLEKAYTTDTNGNIFELKIAYNTVALGGDNTQGRPESISVQTDDGAGNITFRLLPVPDQVYTLTIVYQNAPTLLTSGSSSWAPIPDSYANIYHQFYLSFMLDYLGDGRAGEYRQRAALALLSKAEGLTELEKNQFLSQFLRTDRDLQASQIRTQLGNQGRTV